MGTDRQYTGQISEPQLGIYFYNARYYDPYLVRFIQADTIIPQPGNPQAWDRYSYTYNNPVRYTDPSGHKACEWDGDGDCIRDLDWAPGEDTTSNISNIITPPTTSNKEPDQSLPSFNLGSVINPKAQCTQTSPCMSSWEQPGWWDTDPAHPDYWVLSVNFGEGAGLMLNLIIDRYGNVYGAVGPSIGKSITVVSGSLNGGWIGSGLDDEIPDAGNIDTLITGLSFNLQIGALADGAITWSPPDQFSFEYGVLLPFSAGVSGAYTFKVFDGDEIFGRNK